MEFDGCKRDFMEQVAQLVVRGRFSTQSLGDFRDGSQQMDKMVAPITKYCVAAAVEQRLRLHKKNFASEPEEV